MSMRIKRYILSQMNHLSEKYKYTSEVSAFKILPNKDSPFVVHLPTKDIQFIEALTGCQEDFTKHLITNVEACPIRKGVNFVVDHNLFMQYTIEDVIKPLKSISRPPRNIVIDFSSPNIAKPFHVGHLRSTLIGNFISNINSHLNNNVVKINYLGDWGTQFGLLKVGLEMTNCTVEQVRENPIKTLYEAYVCANKLAKTDETISKRAKLAFNQLENGEPEGIKNWQLYRDFTVEELKNIYERLGVSFNEYHWESMYSSREVKDIIQDLEKRHIITTHEDGHKTASVKDRNVTVMKSDGSTVYLSRDIAAVIDRFKRYSFDEMLYVVDNAQTDHFVALFEIINQMDSPFKNKCKHVKFGRVRGMSTRKGTIVSLRDVLDEAMEKMHNQQMKSSTTKVNLDDDRIPDILGTSAVIINDLKQKRLKDYEFSWDRTLQSHGESGIRLQYLHCRLWSLEQNSGSDIPSNCKPEFLKEAEAVVLVGELARFDDILEYARDEMEACILVKYLFELSSAVNKAFKVLQVKNQPKDIAEQRLLLFHCARLILKKGLEILGLKPLNQM